MNVKWNCEGISIVIIDRPQQLVHQIWSISLCLSPSPRSPPTQRGSNTTLLVCQCSATPAECQYGDGGCTLSLLQSGATPHYVWVEHWRQAKKTYLLLNGLLLPYKLVEIRYISTWLWIMCTTMDFKVASPLAAVPHLPTPNTSW